MTAFSSLMILAVKIDNKEAEEQKAAISQAVSERSVDLTSLVSGMKTCSLSIGDNGRAILTADNAQFKQKQRKVKMREMNCKWLRMSNIS